MMDSETREKNCIPLPANAGPRPYRCEICQRSFREVATLRKHEQLHRADRPYICQTCGKSFLWSSNLKVHERVHTGERPYKCKICHRCFTQSNDLRRHERNVHMRGKLYSYKTPSGRPLPPPAPAPGHMNLAAYQAFALQQRAILQHALTYESLMQNAAAGVSTSSFMARDHPGLAVAASGRKEAEVTTISTSATSASNAQHPLNGRDEPRLPHRDDPSLKLEQVTPPPGEQGKFERSNSNSNLDDQLRQQSPARSAYSPTSSKLHSPTGLSSTTYPAINGHRSSVESPGSQKEDRPPSHESHLDYSKYYASYADPQAKLSDLPHIYRSAFNVAPNSADSVMDLSINKSISSLESDDVELEWKARNRSALSSKSPVSESESDSKRDVTTTSDTPTVDSGIHHCPHCNIFFHDFTMFNLHQSLHSPVDEDPFLCPSCLRRCQDRVEFMFHLVWHVKYPHTIPRYQSFKETCLMGDVEAESVEQQGNDMQSESS